MAAHKKRMAAARKRLSARTIRNWRLDNPKMHGHAWKTVFNFAIRYKEIKSK
jgi:hypothetical protein